jgi:ABC-2 type transport system ATP-binding protein
MQISSTAAVRLAGVTKRFGNHLAVDGLDLEVPAGCIYGFIGPNGSGKTTTLRILLHIYLPDAGSVEVLGMTGTRAANDKIGYLPEERGLYKKMPVRRLLTYYAALKGMNRRDTSIAIETWLGRMELSKWIDHRIEELSKGMAQKIQFIAAMIAQPKLLILDEPFSGLDPLNLEVLRAAILDLRRSGTTIIFSTHDMRTAEVMSDFVCMIYQGRKVLDGTLGEIQARYGADRVRLRLAGSSDFIPTLPEVHDFQDLGRYQQFRYGGDPQQLLIALSNRNRIEFFEVSKPSLHDIFVGIAGAKEENDA